MHLSVYIFLLMQDHMQREEQPYLNRLIDLTLLTPKDTEKVQILQTQYDIHCGRHVHLSI